jgi:membrane-bound lytic murein transglycosylase MltF
VGAVVFLVCCLFFCLFECGIVDFLHIDNMVLCRREVDVNVKVHSEPLKSHKKQYLKTITKVKRKKSTNHIDLLMKVKRGKESYVVTDVDFAVVPLQIFVLRIQHIRP